MAGLDVYYTEDKKQESLLFQINESDLNLLQAELQELEKASGLRIDLYGNTVLYDNHIRHLLQSISVRIKDKEQKYTFDKEQPQNNRRSIIIVFIESMCFRLQKYEENVRTSRNLKLNSLKFVNFADQSLR